MPVLSLSEVDLLLGDLRQSSNQNRLGKPEYIRRISGGYEEGESKQIILGVTFNFKKLRVPASPFRAPP